MTVYRGGQIVKGGLYLKRATWELESVAKEGGNLPGNEETRYSRVPLPAVMAAGPFMGLAYVISSPIVFCLASSYFFVHWVGQKLKITG